MSRQNATGKITEKAVKEKLTSLGLVAEKPTPDRGVDLLVFSPTNLKQKVRLQVKGRGGIQKNKRYRWFQLRTTQKQRETAINEGAPVSEAWKKKIELCDFFVFVSLHHNEHWVFPKDIVPEVIAINKKKYGSRVDNINGNQVEMDLDIIYEGQNLTEKYDFYLNNYALIKEKLNA
jgi:hypothetical protein